MEQTFTSAGARIRHHVVQWRQSLLRPLANGGRIAQFFVRRVRPYALPWATGTALVMGVLWIFLEYKLRGGHDSPSVDLRVVEWLGLSGVVFGLATRARISMSGEVTANVQTSLIVLLVTFVLPAAMLVVYAGVTLSSAGLVSVFWVFWVALLLFAIALQIAIYAGVVGSLIVGGELGPIGIVGFVVIYVGVVCLISNAISGDPSAAWDFSFPSWANARRELIPDWMFVITLLREKLRPLDHHALMSALASVGAGTALALVSSLLVRSGRRALMNYTRLRTFLPMAGAPVADHVPIVHQRMLAPLLTYALLGWCAILVARVL